MIALITPTGARPKQIELCAKFMKKQDYEGKVLWLIIDDALPITTDCITDDFKKDWQILKLYPRRKWEAGENTQARNILAGLKVIQYFTVDAIFIIEDDDYYKSHYLSAMMKQLGDNQLIGEQFTVYYNVVNSIWFQNMNDSHASLFQVAFTPQISPIMEQVCAEGPRYIDMRFFKLVRIKKGKIHLFKDGTLSVGIKGLPGRAGIGMGHRMGKGLYDLNRMTPDPNKVKLKELLKEDYKYYV